MAPGASPTASSCGDWNHDAPAAEHWMQGLLAPDLSVLRMSSKYPADPIYTPR